MRLEDQPRQLSQHGAETCNRDRVLLTPAPALNQVFASHLYIEIQLAIRILTAWNVELTELGNSVPGWTFDSNAYGSSGPPYDLASHVMQIEVNDVNNDGAIVIDSGDTITIGGVPQQIGLIYYGDTAIIDGVTLQTVSFYVGPLSEVPVVLPIINGKISGAYAGRITSSVGTGSFNQPIPFDEFACFVRGTMIAVAHGTRPVETLEPGDLVMTRDNGLQPIRWIGSARGGGRRTGIPENLRPIRISAGALGTNVPSQDLLVSPQHRILVCSKIAQRMFGAEEILVAAKQLLQLDGVEIADDLREVEYFHILFDRHEIVTSGGAQTESLYTGPEALKLIGAQAREEIFTLFPELREHGHLALPARPLVKGRKGLKLVARHAEHQRALV